MYIKQPVKKKNRTSQQKKTSFRATKKWQQFREKLKLERKVDFITGKPLHAGYNVHHCLLDEDEYNNLSNPDNFVCLNKSMHKVVHDVYRYYAKDPAMLDRLKEVLDKMIQLNT